MVLTATMTAGASGPYTTAHDKDGMVTVNGARTFILGTYYASNKYTAEKPALDRYQELAEAGFNLVRASGADMDLAQQAGLMTWTDAGTLDLNDREASAKALADRVNAVKNHPSLAFLETVDEPAWTWMKAEARIPAQALVDAYPLIKQADPNHLLYTNHAPTNLEKTLKAYTPGTDITAVDIYPINPGGLKTQYALFEDGLQGDLLNTYISQVGEYADKMRRVAGPDKPLFMVLQGFAWEMLTEEKERRTEKILYPSYSESRFMAHQSVIHGANGIVYWGTHFTPQPSDCWDGIKRVVRQLADLAGPLAAPSADMQIAIDYEELGRSIDKGIEWRAKQHDGKLYLFTCNADKNPCKAAISGLGAWKTCTVLNENRTLPVVDGSITDAWSRFDVHTYELAPKRKCRARRLRRTS